MPNKSKTAKGGKKIVKAWALIENGVLDVNYDIYDTERMAKRYGKSYRSLNYVVPCTISYSLKAKKK